jgi:predicted Zn-dependent protease
LASVLAHEIAHVKLRHGLDLYDKAGGVNNLTMLSVLAGILLGGANAEIGNALIFGGVASGRQAMVSFTRENEYEADRFGMTLLQNAGFDSRGMVEFFKILDRYSNSSGFQNIEYLRTHPLNQNRISEAESRVKSIVRQGEVIDYFPVFKDYLSDQMDLGSDSSGSDFLRGLTLKRAAQYEKADALLSKLYQRDSENIWFATAYSQNLQNLTRWEEAEQVYRKLLNLFPGDLAVSLQLLDLLKNREQYGPALEIARTMERQYSELPALYAQLTEIYMGLGQNLQGLISEAQYHHLTGNDNRAVKLYDQILASKGLNITMVFRIKQKRARIVDVRKVN